MDTRLSGGRGWNSNTPGHLHSVKLLSCPCGRDTWVDRRVCGRVYHQPVCHHRQMSEMYIHGHLIIWIPSTDRWPWTPDLPSTHVIPNITLRNTIQGLGLLKKDDHRCWPFTCQSRWHNIKKLRVRFRGQERETVCLSVSENTLSGILTLRGSVVYGFELSVRVWFVSIVLSLESSCVHIFL